MNELLPSGEISFAAHMRGEQLQAHREEENKALMTQLQQLKAARDALLNEVTFLSSRNGFLEEEAASVPFLREEVGSSRKKCELLLVMLGEKEEEVEAALADMREVKGLYKQQIVELMERIAT